MTLADRYLTMLYDTVAEYNPTKHACPNPACHRTRLLPELGARNTTAKAWCHLCGTRYVIVGSQLYEYPL